MRWAARSVFASNAFEKPAAQKLDYVICSHCFRWHKNSYPPVSWVRVRVKVRVGVDLEPGVCVLGPFPAYFTLENILDQRSLEIKHQYL